MEYCTSYIPWIILGICFENLLLIIFIWKIFENIQKSKQFSDTEISDENLDYISKSPEYQKVITNDILDEPKTKKCKYFGCDNEALGFGLNPKACFKCTQGVIISNCAQ